MKTFRSLMKELKENHNHTTVTHDGTKYHVTTYGKTHTLERTGSNEKSTIEIRGDGKTVHRDFVSDAVDHLKANGHRDIHPKHFSKLFVGGHSK